MTIYFPPTGFKFWYYLGQYAKYIDTKQSNEPIIPDECIGSSSGALLCICTLLRNRYKNKEALFELIKSIALDTLSEYKKHTCFINLYTLNRIFIDKLFEKIDISDRHSLSKIKIISTKLSFKYGFIPMIQMHESIPSTMNELKELILAATYVPFLSNHDYKLYYTINNEHFIDGGIIDYYIPSIYFKDPKNSGTNLFIPSIDSITKSYYEGYNDELIINKSNNYNKKICCITYSMVITFILIFGLFLTYGFTSNFKS
jgi:hypothetical protein